MNRATHASNNAHSLPARECESPRNRFPLFLLHHTHITPIMDIAKLLNPSPPEEDITPRAHTSHSLASADRILYPAAAPAAATAAKAASATMERAAPGSRRSPTLQDLVAVAAEELKALQQQQQQQQTTMTSSQPVSSKRMERGASHEKLHHRFRCEVEDVLASLCWIEGSLRDLRAQNRRRWDTQMGFVRRVVDLMSGVEEARFGLYHGGGDGGGMGASFEGRGANAASFHHHAAAPADHGHSFPLDHGYAADMASQTDMGSMTSRNSFSSTISDPSTSASENDGFIHVSASSYPISPSPGGAPQQDMAEAAAAAAGAHVVKNTRETSSTPTKKKTLRFMKPASVLSPPDARAKRRRPSNRPTPVKKAQKPDRNATVTRSKREVSPSESDEDNAPTTPQENATEAVQHTPSDSYDGSGDESEVEAEASDDDMDVDESTNATTTPTSKTASPKSPNSEQQHQHKQERSADQLAEQQQQHQQLQEQQQAGPAPRYNVPRHRGPRFASGPPGRPFRFQAKPRTVAGIWREYKEGTGGNPALEALEREHGTGWRRGDLRARKYASNYVGGRRGVVEYVERLAGESGWGVDETIRRLDERVDGRISALTDALRRGEDPFEVLSQRIGGKDVE
ncbi:hypothetical protein O9K51_07701 [Purpureocillium lavendulum]|uniref:Transcription activator GCR1-like domain-containing protein n=1 Tax=Purpureocillium lavendulum TaxID=1247861 RepID=A0AB34FKT7_9HYPO|nr:hypothetical protein O9K51_07701 [Purpureocillium lavendulum]